MWPRKCHTPPPALLVYPPTFPLSPILALTLTSLSVRACVPAHYAVTHVAMLSVSPYLTPPAPPTQWPTSALCLTYLTCLTPREYVVIRAHGYPWPYFLICGFHQSHLHPIWQLPLLPACSSLNFHHQLSIPLGSVSMNLLIICKCNLNLLNRLGSYCIW